MQYGVALSRTLYGTLMYRVVFCSTEYCRVVFLM